jgi:hypothetical protein
VAHGADAGAVDLRAQRLRDAGAEDPAAGREEIVLLRDRREGDHVPPDDRGRRVDHDARDDGAQLRLGPGRRLHRHQRGREEEQEQPDSLETTGAPRLLQDLLAEHHAEDGERPRDRERHHEADAALEREEQQRHRDDEQRSARGLQPLADRARLLPAGDERREEAEEEGRADEGPEAVILEERDAEGR